MGEGLNDRRFLFWTAVTPDLAADLVNDRIAVHVTVSESLVASFSQCITSPSNAQTSSHKSTLKSLPLHWASSRAMSVSVSASLRASARAAYRDLLRASSKTFVGDPAVQNGVCHKISLWDGLGINFIVFMVAFRLKMRNEILPTSSTTDPSQFEGKIQLTREIADVLRKNIVQAQKIDSSTAEQDIYSLSPSFPIFKHNTNILLLYRA